MQTTVLSLQTAQLGNSGASNVSFCDIRTCVLLKVASESHRAEEPQPCLDMLSGLDEPVPDHTQDEGPEGQPPERSESQPLLWGAACLEVFGQDGMPERDGLSKKSVSHRMRAAAEHTVRCQEHFLSELCAYLRVMKKAQRFHPVMFLEYQRYDETPLELMVRYEQDISSDRQRAKTVMVESAWAVLLQTSNRSLNEGAEVIARDFLLIRGCHSPALRATQSCTGESLRKVLSHCPVPPLASLAECGFDHLIRLSETDEAGANARCEALTMSDRADAGGPGWQGIQLYCQAHKVHACAVRSWHLLGSTVSGLCHTCKVLTMSGSMAKLRDGLAAVLSRRLEIRRHANMTRQAQAFRDTLIALFAPPTSMPRRRAAVCVFFELLNGDLQDQAVVHVCPPGCCQDRQHTVQKLVDAAGRVCAALNPGMFCPANWSNWHASVRLYGILSGAHGLLPLAFQAAFLDKNQGEAWAAAGEDDNFDLFNAEAEVPPEAAAAPARVIAVDGVAAGHQRSFHISWWHQGSRLRVFLKDTLATLASKTLWSHVPETQAARSLIFRVCARPAATCWQLIWVRLQQCPTKLLHLVTAADKQRLAADILALPNCLVDSFTQGFIAAYPTVPELCGQKALQMLSCLTSHIQGTTFSTERLHSRNLQRAKLRSSRRRADVDHVALIHSGRAVPAHVAKAAPVRRASRKRGRPKTKAAASEEHAQQGKRRRVGGGGAWRCFLNAHLAGEQLTTARVQALAQSYAALSPASKSIYKEGGRAGGPLTLLLHGKTRIQDSTCFGLTFWGEGSSDRVFEECPSEHRCDPRHGQPKVAPAGLALQASCVHNYHGPIKPTIK